MPKLDGIASMQDTTNHPAWTGEENTVSSEDEHMARFLKRFGEQLSSSVWITVTGGTHTARLSIVILQIVTSTGMVMRRGIVSGRLAWQTRSGQS